MIGNQAIINGLILEDERNPIKEPIKGIDPRLIVYTITEEYWKECFRLMTDSDYPEIKLIGLGKFRMRYNKGRQYIYKKLFKIKWYKIKYSNNFETPGSKGYSMIEGLKKRISSTWKQLDHFKKHINKGYELWELKKKLKYGDKAI